MKKSNSFAILYNLKKKKENKPLGICNFSWVQVLKEQQRLRDKHEEFNGSWGALERRREGVGEWEAAPDPAVLEPRATGRTCALTPARVKIPAHIWNQSEKVSKSLTFSGTMYIYKTPRCQSIYTPLSTFINLPCGGHVGGGGSGEGGPAARRALIGNDCSLLHRDGVVKITSSNLSLFKTLILYFCHYRFLTLIFI